jgi:AcrR family transcriptional regulator
MSTYHHGDLAVALLEAAGKSLEKEGVGGLSLRGAARRAKVSHNAPYRHFRDREALLAALAEEGFRILGERLQGLGAREMGEAYVRFALEHPQRFRLMFGGLLQMARHPRLRESAQGAYQALKAAMSELPQPEVAAAAAWSMVHGLAHLTLDGHFQPDEEFARRVLGAVRFAQRAA